MSTLQQIDSHSANDAPDSVAVSLSEGERKIIRLRWPGATSSRNEALQSCRQIRRFA